MLHVYEFEIFEGDNGLLLSFPYDLEGGTQGGDFKEACEMTADWLQSEMEHRAMHNIPFPNATFGNKPRHKGQNIIVAVNAGVHTVAKVLPSEAARMLGVTPGRVTQMVASGLLESFETEGRSWITINSIEARLAEHPKAGRPRKKEMAHV